MAGPDSTTPYPEKLPGASRWELNREAFDSLLSLFDSDRASAALKYESLRRKLQLFFEARGCAYSEELVDAVMDRVAQKLQQGTEILRESYEQYFYGVARYIRLEEYKRRSRMEISPLKWVARDWRVPSSRDELDCVIRCLDGLEQDERDLVLNYYEGEGRAKLKNRQRLADRLGITHEALVSRVFRIRARLDKCARKCLKGGRFV